MLLRHLKDVHEHWITEAWEIYLEDKELWELVMLNPPERVLTPAEQKKNRRAYYSY